MAPSSSIWQRTIEYIRHEGGNRTSWIVAWCGVAAATIVALVPSNPAWLRLLAAVFVAVWLIGVAISLGGRHTPNETP